MAHATAGSTRSYQDLQHELDAVLSELQDESTDLDTAAALHKRGLELIQDLRVYLEHIEKEAATTQSSETKSRTSRATTKGRSPKADTSDSESISK